MGKSLVPQPRINVSIHAHPRSTGRYAVTLYSEWPGGCATRPMGVLNTADLIHLLAANHIEDMRYNGSGMA